MRIEDCTYDPVKKRSTGETLRMGQACKYCRSVKTSKDARKRRADIRIPSPP